MIAAYLDLSTSHLTLATASLLEDPDAGSNCGWPAMTIAPYAYGAFVTVPYDFDQEQWETLPVDLAQVFRAARDMAIPLLRFDAEGDVLPILPTYNW